MKSTNIFANEKLINLMHPAILAEASGKMGMRSTPLMSIDRYKRVSFSVAAAEQCNMRVGKHVHFINMGGKWFFVVNDSPEGFKLIPKGNNNASVCFHNTPFVRMFRKETGNDNSQHCTFFIQHTNSELNGAKVFEILTQKTRQQMMKDA